MFLTLHFIPHLPIQFHAFERAEKSTPSNKHLVRIHKIKHVKLRIGQKVRELVYSQQCLQFVTCLPFCQNLNKRIKENNENK